MQLQPASLIATAPQPGQCAAPIQSEHSYDHVKDALGYWMRVQPPSGMPRILAPESSHLAGLMGEMIYARRDRIHDAELTAVQRTCLYAGLVFLRITALTVPLLRYEPAP